MRRILAVTTLSLTLAGTGSGSERWFVDDFRKAAEATAKQYDTLGSEGVAKTYGMGPARIPFEVKDPRGFAEFYDQFASHSAKGAANTLRGYQIGRPSVYDLWRDLRDASSQIRPDWDLSTAGLREAWDAGDRSPFHGWNRRPDPGAPAS